MITWQNIGSTICLVIVFFGCFLHLVSHVDQHSPACERLGFVLTCAGAFGEIVYRWWPKIESFPFELLLHTGMALIALALMRGQLRGWVARIPGMKWTERREHPQ